MASASDIFDRLLPGEKPTYDDLVEAVRALAVRKADIAVQDLPMQGIKANLEQTWQPSASVLLGNASVTPAMLAVRPGVTRKAQNLGAAAQSGPANGVPWSYNVASAPFIDLTPGTWTVHAAAFATGNVSDAFYVGLFNETAGAGISGSAGVSGMASTTFNSSSPSHTVHTVTVSVPTRLRIWMLPNGVSTQTVTAFAGPTAFMHAEKAAI